MGKVIAKIISYLFHPLFMPTIGIFILFNSGSHLTLMSFDVKKILFLITFASTCILPLLFLPFFIYRNLIKSFRMESSKERIYPLSLVIIFYFFTYYIIQGLPISGFIVSFLLGSFIAVFILFLITLKWKISAHMTGIGGILGLLIGSSIRLNLDLQFFIITTFLIIGLLGYSRLKLNEHNPAQIYSGIILGFLSVFSTIFFY